MTVQTLAIIVLLVSFFVMIFLRFPIAYAVGLSSVLCMMVQGQALTDVCRLMVKGISSFSLMAVPFFITMGVLMGSGGISEKLIALADACVGWMRGGMARRFGQPEGGALVLLGHGTEHFANMVYPAMQTALRLAGGRRAYMGTVEGWPGFDEVLAQLKEDGCGQALLVPFMLVAGDHALNDMAGDGPKSWKSRLEAAGVGVRCRMRGLGTLPEVQALYGARLREIV